MVVGFRELSATSLLWSLFAVWSTTSAITTTTTTLLGRLSNNNHQDSSWPSEEELIRMLILALVLRSVVVGFVTQSKRAAVPVHNMNNDNNYKYWRQCEHGPTQQQQQQQQQGTKASGLVMACALYPTLVWSVIRHVASPPTIDYSGSIKSLTLFFFFHKHSLVYSSLACLWLLLEQQQQQQQPRRARTTRRILGWLVPIMVVVVAVAAAATMGAVLGSSPSFLFFIIICLFYMVVFGGFFYSLFHVPSLWNVWTTGEWALVTNLMTTLVMHHVVTTMTSATSPLGMEHLTMKDDRDYDDDLVYLVARSGFLGAVLVCPLIHSLWPLPSSSSSSSSLSAKPNVAAVMTTQTMLWNACRKRVAVSIMLILAFVELHLIYFAPNDNNNKMSMMMKQEQQEHAFFVIPKCLTWLGRFLSRSEMSCFLDTNKTSFVLSLFPRYYWILYWAIVLFVTLVWLPSSRRWQSRRRPPPPRQQDDPDSSSRVLSLSSHVPVTLTRKWFHWVAVLLFCPTTVCAPRLQALSYAIALSILILVEGLYLRCYVPSLQVYFEAFLDPSKQEMAVATLSADERDYHHHHHCSRILVSHICLIAGCATPLYIALFLIENTYDAIRDNTISLAKTKIEENEASVIRLFYLGLSFMGIVTLGVGDAAAAVIGTLYRQWWQEHERMVEGGGGNYNWMFYRMFQRLESWTPALSQWGRLNRTWVGSLAMMLAMHVFVQMLGVAGVAAWWPALLWTTVLEAYTSQLDNLLLPLVGVTAFLQTSFPGG